VYNIDNISKTFAYEGDNTVEEIYHNNIIKEKIWRKNGKLYRENNLPSKECYDLGGIIRKIFTYEGDNTVEEIYHNNIIKEKIWRKDDKLYRENNLPSKEIYNENGELIESLFIDEYNKVFNSYIGNEDCGICYQRDNNMISTKCNHIFCKKCIDSWMDTRSDECPYCRQSL